MSAAPLPLLALVGSVGQIGQVPSLSPAAVGSTLLWTAPLALPVLAALFAPLLPAPRRHPLVVLATLPALVFALVPPAGPPPDVTWLLLDLELGVAAPRRLLLAAIALVWLAGAVAARDLVTSRLGTATVWLLALTGNLGVVVAADLVTLYAGFAVMTFAAYPLVVHDRSASARRAGRVYIVLSVVGEALVLAGMLLAASRAGTTSLEGLAEAIGLGQVPTGGLAMMVAGFAVKAGVIPLHLWLPLAHPAAPVPASAVLSGAMIKAGVVGWLSVLALESGPPAVIGRTLIVAGLVSILVAALLGVTQEKVKVVLAYSSISQVGFITVVVGVGATDPRLAVAAATAAGAYVLHHGLAKAAMFLSVAVTDRLPRRVVLVGTAAAGLALAGAPATSGYLAKQAVKDTVGLLPAPTGDQLTLALSVGAIGTTLLVARVLVLLARTMPAASVGGAGTATAGRAADGMADPAADVKAEGMADPAAAGGDAGAARVGAPTPRWSGPTVAWLGLLVGVLGATYVLPGVLTDTWQPPRFTASAVFAASWPVLVGAGLSGAALWVARLQATRRAEAVGGAVANAAGGGAADAADGAAQGAPASWGRVLSWRPPPGDLVVPLEAASRTLGRGLRRLLASGSRAGQRLRATAERIHARYHPLEAFGRLDERLTRWRSLGLSFLVVALLLLWALRP